MQKKHREDVGEKLKISLSSVFDADIKHVVETTSSRKEKTKKSVGDNTKQDNLNKLLKQIQVDSAKSPEQQDNQGTNENEGRIEASAQYEQSSNGSEKTNLMEEVEKSGISSEVLQHKEETEIEEDNPEENTKVKHNGEDLNIVNERAEALESLLELCANLVQNDKFDELAGILQPFGNESASSRETAIWLTKSLISMPKYGLNSK